MSLEFSTVTNGSAPEPGSSIRILALIPGQRPVPEGLVIRLNEQSETVVSDLSWQDESGTTVQEVLHLYSEFRGENCGGLSARLTVRKDPADERIIRDRYLLLTNIQVRPTSHGSMRNMGIGSALLAAMEEYAVKFGASRIEGTILPTDLLDTPGLPSFYEKCGYQLTPRARNGGFTMVKHLNK